MNTQRYAKRPIILLVFTVLVLLLESGGALAQAAISALGITLVDTSAFPTIRLYLSVTNPDRQPAKELPAQAFTVYENNVPISDFTVEAVEHPMLIGVVIDSAVSFNTREGGAPRVEKAKEAARWLLDPQYQRLLPDDYVAIYAFQEGQPVRLVDFTYDLQMVLDQGINQVSTAGNQYTALLDILCQAITETATRQGARRRALLVFSDGVDRTSGLCDVDRVIQEAVDAHMLIYTVGMGGDLALDRPGSTFLRRLADETGGQYMWYRPGRTGEEEAMNAFLGTMLTQRAGYLLSYSSNQYQGNPEVRLVVQSGDAVAEDMITFAVPPLPPAVSVDNLTNGQVLVGVTTIQPSIARAQRDIDHVEYYVDDGLVYTAKGAPWAFDWDTTQGYASTCTEPEAHTLRVKACDIGDQCGEASLTLGIRLPCPTPTPTPIPLPTPQPPTRDPIQLGISIGALVVALGALVALVIVMRRGGARAMGNVVAEVRRRTRVWRQRTGIFGGGVPAARQSMATLTVISDMLKDKQFNLEESVVFVGREEERADIILYWDENVSRRHAKIAQEGNQFYIWDMNSTNGTWVNEQRVPRSLSEGVELREAVPLRDGDVIRFGPDLRLRFNVASKTEPQPPPEPVRPPEAEAQTQVLKAPPSTEPPPVVNKPGPVDTQASPRNQNQ